MTTQIQNKIIVIRKHLFYFLPTVETFESFEEFLESEIGGMCKTLCEMTGQETSLPLDVTVGAVQVTARWERTGPKF